MSGIDDVRARFAEAETLPPGPDGVPSPCEDRSSGPGDPPPTDDDALRDLLEQGARLPLNDTGNGQRFALYQGQQAITVPRVGWHCWDGRRWKLDQDRIAVRGLAQTIQRHILEEIPHLVLETWQIREIDAEPAVRAEIAQLRAVEDASRTTEQEARLEDLGQRLTWIRKLKDRKSGMKSDHRSFAKTSGNTGRIDAMLTEATVALSREVEDLNADPLTVATETGLLRFSVVRDPDSGLSPTADMRVEPHAREVEAPGRARPQLVTQLMPVEHDPSASCPRFDDFLARVQPDAEMRAFLQRWFGLSMTGLKIQKFAFLHGSGANGKSVLVDLMARMIGDYAHAAKIESFTGRNRRGGGDATPDIFPLMGARMVRASEPEEGERLQEGLIKELTGGEPILVRQLHADFIEVHPFFKLTVSGNHKPDIRGTDDGIWRRVLLVPFDVQIPKEERDEALGETLWKERSGILNWMVAGLIDYLEGGLQEPAKVLDATSEYRADSDPIGSFLQDACLVTGDPGDFVLARDLIQGFNLWLDLRGDGMWGDRTVSLKFKAQAERYRDGRTGKTYTSAKRDASGYRGIRFVDTFQRSFDTAPRDAKGRPVASARGGSDEGWMV